MPEETPGKGLSPGKVVLPCKKQLTKYRHLERSLVIQSVAKNLLERTPHTRHGVMIYND